MVISFLPKANTSSMVQNNVGKECYGSFIYDEALQMHLVQNNRQDF